METVERGRSREAEGLVGSSVRRTEDARLLRGEGKFIDDLEPVPDIAHAAILRSTEAHARIVSVDASETRDAPGVLGVLTGEDIVKLTSPFSLAVSVPVEYYALAVKKVRYVGEPVAVVVAEDRYTAEDALESIHVEYEPLEAVLDVEAALEADAPLLHESVGSNAGNHRTFEFGDPGAAFDGAAVVVEDRFVFPRYSSTPIETYGVIADYEAASDSVEIWANFHGPFILHRVVAGALGIPQNRVSLVVPPDIGGSFGIKSGIYPYMVLAAVASRIVGRPVKWIEDRIEHLLASCSGTGRVSYTKAAFRKDGELIGLDYRFLDDVGGYIRSPEPATMFRCFGNFTGAYDVQNIKVETFSVMTNKMPTGLNRGFGGPQLYTALERVMDLGAKRLGLNAAQVRRRNFIHKEQFPYRTPTGGLYDSGDYEAVFERTLELAKYEELVERREKAREEGKLFGVGLATIVDPSGTNMGYVTLANPREDRTNPLSGCTEAATVSMDPSGGVIVRLTSTPQGQGHETVAAQVAADELGVPPEQVNAVAEMDTSAMPWTITTGSYSSRFAPLTSSAVALAARRVREKLARVAAHELGVEADDLELVGGKFALKDDPEISFSLRRAAGVVHWNAASLSEGIEPGLYETAFFSLPVVAPPDEEDKANSSATYGFVSDLVAVEIDLMTYDIQIVDYVTVHDAGTILNPMIVEGQVHGAAVHGIGGALYEEFRFDESGQMQNASFMDYLCPTATEAPDFKTDHIETPSPFSLLGAKGAGEGNSMSAPAAVANAVADALEPLGISVSSLPVTPSAIFDAVEAGEERT